MHKKKRTLAVLCGAALWAAAAAAQQAAHAPGPTVPAAAVAGTLDTAAVAPGAADAASTVNSAAGNMQRGPGHWEWQGDGHAWVEDGCANQPCESRLTSVTTAMPADSQSTWATVWRALRRACNCGIRSASAT